MSSTRVISLDFECSTPRSLDEALEALNEEGAQVLAGGTDLINNIKTNAVEPRRLVYILGIADLDYVTVQGNSLSIGAGARLGDIEHHRQVVSRFPALCEAIDVIGGTQIRNMATLAGNICNASPGADTPPILLVLDAEVEICGASKNVVALLCGIVDGIYAAPSQPLLDELGISDSLQFRMHRW